MIGLKSLVVQRVAFTLIVFLLALTCVTSSPSSTSNDFQGRWYELDNLTYTNTGLQNQTTMRINVNGDYLDVFNLPLWNYLNSSNTFNALSGQTMTFNGANWNDGEVNGYWNYGDYSTQSMTVGTYSSTVTVQSGIKLSIGSQEVCLHNFNFRALDYQSPNYMPSRALILNSAKTVIETLSITITYSGYYAIIKLDTPYCFSPETTYYLSVDRNGADYYGHNTGDEASSSYPFEFTNYNVTGRLRGSTDETSYRPRFTAINTSLKEPVTIITSGKYGNGGSFDGTNDYINAENINYANQEKTFCSWIYSNKSYSFISNYGQGGSGSQAFGQLEDGRIRLELVGNGGMRYYSTSTPNLNEWNYICYTVNNELNISDSRTSSDGDIYINGIKETLTTSVIGTSTYNYNNLVLGVYSPTNKVSTLEGFLDEVRIWNRSLNVTEINEEMNSGVPVNGEDLILSYSFEDYNTTHVRDTDYLVKGKQEGEVAYNFNEPYKYVSNDSFEVFYNHSVFAWVKPYNLTGTNYIVNLRDNNGLYLSIQSNGYLSVVNCFGGCAIQVKKLLTSSNINVYNYVGYTLDGNNLILYLNGEVVASTIMTQSIGIVGTTIDVGNAGSHVDRFFRGSISEVVVYNKSLSELQIKSLYDASLDSYSSIDLVSDSFNIEDLVYLTVATTNFFSVLNSSSNALELSDVFDYVNISVFDNNNNPITSVNSTLRVTTPSSTTYEISFNHTKIINITESGLYTFRITADGYGSSTKSFNAVSIGNYSSNFYLIMTTDNVQFNYKDDGSGYSLENVYVIMKGYINGVLTLIESKYTDISGAVIFSINDEEQYCFESSKNGYLDKNFCFDSIGSTNYNVLMTPTTTANVTVNLEDVIVNFIDKNVKDNTTVYAEVLISSNDGLLNDYWLSLTLPNGTIANSSGSSSHGQILNTSHFLSGSVNGDILTFTVGYTTDRGSRTKVYSFLVTDYQSTSLKQLLNPDNTGLSDVWLAILSTIIILMIAGIGGVAGSAIGEPLVFAGSSGLIITGFMAYIGWIPWWGFLASAFVVVMMISNKVGGGN